ncbi:unnamed protein product [Clonostachys byssicola]|uniref:B30.2/SPRY domain-containing protein n=1 Tax=Clonostachys byssicola TaxID=160290 RepID=A0A9N9TZQ3_9HYPO|nr:unnamed protein product [Clonostachys byssicola]
MNELLSNAKGRLEPTPYELNGRAKFNVIVVHGIGTACSAERSSFFEAQESRPDRSEFYEILNSYIPCARVVEYNYSVNSIHRGIPLADVQYLARFLLDEMLKEHQKWERKEIVFVGEDLGGIIIKEALSMALENDKYSDIAAQTASLVFFQTPHRLTDDASWYSLANWLFFASELNHLYSLDWIQIAAKMIQQVAEDFDPFQKLYCVLNIYPKFISPHDRQQQCILSHISLPKSCMIFDITNETNLPQDVPHSRSLIFTSGSPSFESFCDCINASSSPGKPLINTLQTLRSISRLSGDMFNMALYRQKPAKVHASLQAHESYRQWISSLNGSLEVVIPSYSEALLAFSAITEPKTFADYKIIKYTSSAFVTSHQVESNLLASLCFQLLCLNPSIFYVVNLSYSLRDLICERSTHTIGLINLLRSLTGRGAKEKVVCVIQETPFRKIPEHTLEAIQSLANADMSNFKVIIIRNAGLSSRPIVRLVQDEPDIEAVLDCGLDALISKRPKLSPSRGSLREIVLAQHKGNPGFFVGPDYSILEAIQAWLELLIKMSEPLSIFTVHRTLALMPNSLQEIYETFLQLLPAHTEEITRTALSWIASSQRPLNLEEVGVACALAANDVQAIDDLYQGVVIDLEEILLSSFGSVIYIDQDMHLHIPDGLRQPVLDFEKERNKHSAGFNSKARNCLDLLSLYRHHDPLILAKLTSEHPFLEYAVTHWVSHYESKITLDQEGERGETLESDLSSELSDYVNNNELMQFWATMYALLQHQVFDDPVIDPLVIAAECGSLRLVQFLLSAKENKKPTDDLLLRSLNIATSRGDLDMVKVLIRNGADRSTAINSLASSGHCGWLKDLDITKRDMEAADTQGLTALHYACRSGSATLVEGLLKEGADVNARSGTQMTPLHMACQFGHVAIIRYLLQHDNLNINSVSSFGTPLAYACRWQKYGAVDALIREKGQKIDITIPGEDDQRTALHHAAEQGHLDILKRLLGYLISGSSETDPDTYEHQESPSQLQPMLKAQDCSGFTPLHLAAKNGHVEVTKEIWKRANDKKDLITTRDNDNNYPIDLATIEGHTRVVELLLDEAARPQLVSCNGKDGDSPIHLAVMHSHYQLLEVLVQNHKRHEIYLDVFNVNDICAVHIAAQDGQIALLRKLKENGAKMDVLDSNDATPLLLACRHGQSYTATFLIENGASVNLADEDGASPLGEAIKTGMTNVVKHLLKAGAKADMYADTRPLLLAIERGSVAIVSLLKPESSDWLVKDSQQRTALHLAARSRSDATIKLVLEHSKEILQAKDTNGRTALHDAVEAGSYSIVDKLLDAGVDPSIRDNNDRIPLELTRTEDILRLLMFACESDNIEDKVKALQHSLEHGFLSSVRGLLEQDPELGKMNSGMTALHIAAKAGQIGLITDLIHKYHFSPSDRTNSGRTALSFAAEKGHLEIVKELYSETPHGVDGADSEKNTPFFYACKNGHVNIVSYYLRDAVPPVINDDLIHLNGRGEGVLWAAVTSKSPKTVELILNQLVQFNDPAHINRAETAEEGLTPLHYAVRDNNLEIVDLLLAARGIDGSLQDKRGRTPIFLAAYDQRKESVDKLIKSGWMANVPNKHYWGWYPIHAAYDNSDILELLIKAQSYDIDAVDMDGQTALYAASRSHEGSVEVLLQGGANPLLADKASRTPLHVAAAYLDSKTVDMMLDYALEKEKGEELVDTTAFSDEFKFDILSSAVNGGNTPVVELLLERQLFRSYDSALEVAIEADRPDAALALLKNAGSEFGSKLLERALRWATLSEYGNLQSCLIKILQAQPSDRSWDDEKLFDASARSDNIELIKLLRQRGSIEMTTRTDKQHGWSLSQILEAYGEIDGEDNVQLAVPLPPSQWDINHKADCITASRFGEDGPLLILTFDSTDIWPGAVLSDHPIPPGNKFYFEVLVLEYGTRCIYIGLGRGGCDVERMPGWDPDTWGLYSGNGGLYHNNGLHRHTSSEREFGAGDTIGILVDTLVGKVFYSKNGKHFTSHAFTLEQTTLNEIRSLPPDNYLIHATNCIAEWGAGIAAELPTFFPQACKEYKKISKAAKTDTSERWPPRSLVASSSYHSQKKWQQVRPAYTSFVFSLGSYGYGRPNTTTGKPGKDSTEMILRQRGKALTDSRAHLGNETNNPDSTAIYSPMFNSGAFRVPWEKTKGLIEEEFEGWEGRWLVMAPPS